MSTEMHPFVAFGSDTDCDGTTYYACGVEARDEDHAWEVLREDFGGMTAEGVYKILPYAQAVREDKRVLGIMARTFDGTPFRYESLGADWNPWVYDDSIGIPALDSRFEDPAF